MNIDRVCWLILGSLLPLLHLPQNLLGLGVVWAMVLGGCALYRKSYLLVLVALLVSCGYIRIILFAENVQQQTAYTTNEVITVRQILKQNEYQAAIAQRHNGEKLYVIWQSNTALQSGGRYQAELRIRPVASRLNDGNFNRQRWLLAQHIQATATVKQANYLGVEQSLRLVWLEQVRQQTAELSTQGILLALAFGERAWLSLEHWQLFQQTATAHLIAISGLHIALAFGIGFWFAKGCLGGLGWLFARLKWPQAVRNPHFFAIFIGFLTACLYSFLAGFAIPTTRALIAISFVLTCRLARRHYTAWQLWTRGVTLLVILDPLTLLSDSFWLSILAVAALIFWYRYFPLSAFPHLSDWQKSAKWKAFLLNLLHLQLGITLCFLPVQFYFFEGHSLLAFWANLGIVPLYSFCAVPLILFGLFVNQPLLWALVEQLLQFSITFLKPLAGEWKILSRYEQWQWLVFALFVLAVLHYRHYLRDGLSAIVVASLACLQLPQGLNVIEEKPLVEWWHFDVGQGLAMAFIYYENDHKKAVLYDTGASWAGGSMAELEIIPFLKRHGIAVESIILSHEDNDHAGGIQPLLAHYPQAELIVSGENRYSAQRSSACKAGQTWRWGQLQLTALFPPQVVKKAKNEHSCVLVASIGQFRILLTGDSGGAQERDFAAKVGKVDFLQVGHHGSKTSTSYTLLAQTQPDYALISAGRFNPWKMPSLSVVSRLDEFGIKHLNTAKQGMITVRFYADRYEIETSRHRRSAWYVQYLGQ